MRVQLNRNELNLPTGLLHACILRVTRLAGDVKKPSHLLKRVGHLVPGIAVWHCVTGWCFTKASSSLALT